MHDTAQGQHFQHMLLGRISIPTISGMSWTNMDAVASLATQFPLARTTNSSLGGSSTSSQPSTDVTDNVISQSVWGREQEQRVDGIRLSRLELRDFKISRSPIHSPE